MTSDAIAYEPTILDRARWWLRGRLAVAVGLWRNICDWLKWIGHKESNLETYARTELERAGWFEDDGFYGSMMGRAVLRMIREFSEEGHSGMSAPLAVNLFKEVAAFHPLTPLTGEDDEWNECGTGVFQNRRCSHVFKEAGGRAYDIEGRIFRGPDGDCYTGRGSRVFIDFPYLPKREYVDVDADGNPVS